MIKNQKGVTLVTLVIYVISILLIISALAIINQIFFNNADLLTESSHNMAEYNKFNMYFLEDVKNNSDAAVLEEGTAVSEEVEGNEIVFKDGTTYIYKEEDSGIYRNKVKICENIEACSFTKKIVTNEDIDFEKKVIEVSVDMNSGFDFSTVLEYVLKYW